MFVGESIIIGRVSVSQSFTLKNRQDFKNRMMRSTPVVLRQARGKLPGLVVPGAIHGTFRRITQGIPHNRHLNVWVSELQEVEGGLTLDSFLEQHEYPFRQPDVHKLNIIDLDIDSHQKTLKHKFLLPNLKEECSLGQIYTSRLHHSIRDGFDFTAGIIDYLLMTEQEAQTDWHHRNFCFLLFVEGKEGIFIRRANRENPTAF